MCKRILTIAAVVVAVSGLALADTAIIHQTAGGFNKAETDQSGSGNNIDIDQTANKDNVALIDQSGIGNEVVIKQLARTYVSTAEPGYNFAGWQATTALIQLGNNNKVDVDQDAFTDNQLMVYQYGNRNKVVGALWDDGTIDENAAARQVSTGTYNYMGILSVGYDNRVGLNMLATGINEAYIWQDGSRNAIGLSSYARNGNTLIGGNLGYPSRDGIIQDGEDNLVWLNQNAGTDNIVTYAKQIGDDNKLVGADYCGAINTGTAAYQYAGTGSNQLDSTQTGDGNTIGLYQYASDYNIADIDQFNGNNNLGAYQSTTGGYNELNVIQSGGDTATVCQIAGSYNIATVTQ